MTLRGLLAFCFFSFACAASAQFLPATQDALESDVLKQKRPIEVYLPEESAKNAGQRYETLYVLDGDWNAQIVLDIVRFMRKVGAMPPVIVVSVPNVFDEHGVNSRDHDLTPTAVEHTPRSGGAASFLAFLKTELVPYVDAHFPANGVHLIHGHSYGGLFLIYALIHDPALFDGYAIIDPAMGFDDHVLDKPLESALPTLPTKGKAIYIAARTGHAYEYMGLSTIEPIFKAKAPADLHWNITAYPGESHDSLKLKGTYDALKFAYQGYTTDTIEMEPTGGIVLDGQPVRIGVNGDPDRYDLHYTTDGSMPTAASPRVGDAIAVSDPAKTTIKLLSNRGTFDRVIPIHLKRGKAIAPPTRATKPQDAWQVAFYPADAWPMLDRRKPAKTIVAGKTLDFGEAGREAFAGSIERTLAIPDDGYYVLGVATSSKARVSLNGRVLFEHDGAHGYQQSFIAPLRRGAYPVRVDFVHAAKGADLEVAVFPCKDGEPQWKQKLFGLMGQDAK